MRRERGAVEDVCHNVRFGCGMISGGEGRREERGKRMLNGKRRKSAIGQIF